MRSLLLVSDCHISPLRPDHTAEALARLLMAHPHAELVLDGDTWDLPCAAFGRSAAETLVEWVLNSPSLVQALAARLVEGIPVTVVAGNHDAALADPAVGRALRVALRVQDSAPLSVSPWLVRRGGVHIEHGHFFDPDNAPLLPLGGPHAPDDEPLGVALTRRFVAPTGATVFAHAHETTPLVGLWRTLRDFGPRAPVVVLAYYRTALGLTMEAARRRRAYDHEAAVTAWLRTQARNLGENGESSGALVQLPGLLPRPTHTSGSATFERLFLDRSLACAAIGLGVTCAWLGPLGAYASGLGAAYLVLSALRRGSRSAGSLEASLEAAACAIAKLTGAQRVVFGHTHRTQSRGPYVNLGSFGIARFGARSWAHADEQGRVSLECFVTA